MITMLSVLYVDQDQDRPVKVVTDKAYGMSHHFCPLHTMAELRLMNLNDHAAAEAEDSRNQGLWMAVELSVTILDP
jgi:hypothetical protein